MPRKKNKKPRRPAVISRADALPLYPNEVSPWRIFKIMAEFVNGFEFLKKCEGAISFFGTARNTMEPKIYQEATKLARHLSRDGFAIITGGGPGIMEAANKGAYLEKGESIGIGIQLPLEQAQNKFVTEGEYFKYFFVRKLMLSFASQAYIFFPGGFGTLDELFEMLTLVQTEKIDDIPIILVGAEFWTPILTWIDQALYKKYHAIDKKDLNIYRLVDSADEAYDLIQALIKEGRIKK